MLVLTRTKDDSVIITHPDGTKIEIIVNQITNGKVKLGFIAPPHIRILRKELETNEPDSN